MAITKRVRFEVFKRDKFTCQYCGKAAPDVVLHVDHMEPKSKGGTDDLLNLTTSCVDCNLGKGARRLSDDSVVTRQREQLEALQSRQEQIQMMIEWQRSLVDLDSQEVDSAAGFWCDLADWIGVTDTGKAELRKMIRRHGLAEVLEAMRAAQNYFRMDDEGNLTNESTVHAFRKIGGICRIRAAEGEKPYLKDLFYIRGILRNRLGYVNDRQARELLDEALSSGVDAEELKNIARSERNWTNWRTAMEVLLAGMGGEAANG
jgi:hypothetical protein